MGAKYMYANGFLYLLYMDNIENANIPIDSIPKPYKDGNEAFLSAYVVDDETGSVEKHVILTMKNIKGIKAYQFNAGRIFNLKENVFMIEIYIKDKKDTMVKLELVK
jgi:ribosomal protein L21E